MKGRKPKPARLKVIQGNPGKRPVNDVSGIPDLVSAAPEYLTKTGKDEWDRVYAMLADSRIITEADRSALAAYCDAYARWVENTQAVARTGVLIKTSNGFPIQSPLLGIVNRASAEMRAWMVELGITPSSRSRVTPAGKTEEKSWFDSL